MRKNRNVIMKGSKPPPPLPPESLFEKLFFPLRLNTAAGKLSGHTTSLMAVRTQWVPVAFHLLLLHAAVKPLINNWPPLDDFSIATLISYIVGKRTASGDSY